jgi:hypothetical protein
MPDINVEINFTDITIVETDGVYEEVNRLMLEHMPSNYNWVIRSEATIITPSGIGNMVLQFHSDKSFYIIDYNPSIGDVFYNYDVQSISLWSQEKGWKIPQPHYDLVRYNKEFWKHFWETLVIDSDYLDKLYGERKQLKKNN